MEKLDKSKINVIRQYYIRGELKTAHLARELQINPCTVTTYFREFQEIERLYPKKLRNFAFFLPKRKRWNEKKYHELMEVLPGLIESSTTNCLKEIDLWTRYRLLCPRGWTINNFYKYYNEYKSRHNLCRFYKRHVTYISPQDEQVLIGWRNSKNIHEWRKGVTILDSLKKRPVAEISAQVEIAVESILKWIDLYKEKGITSLQRQPFNTPADKVAFTKLKRENLLKLLQQTPKLHGLNRTSWRLLDISRTYEKVYGYPLGPKSIRLHLRHMGYQFQKSREKLSSPDKHFREKMDRIKSILSNLKPDEKFFSVDEYGPAAVKMKVGWTFTLEGERTIVPQNQKSKGWYVMTAALELSTNQVTQFYCRKKDSEEMIKLVDMLCLQYRGNSTIYLSWDCASWHNSKKLKQHLKEINSLENRMDKTFPMVEIAPLPSSAQFLNVIESVFSGMAKSIIHNSDYASLEECKEAIDRYFKERNEHYLANPHRAGNKIWGKEIVVPEFKETNHCKKNLKSADYKAGKSKI